jgi:PPM family protein phosphatase
MECQTFSAMIIGPRNKQEDAITDGKTVFQADYLTRKNVISDGNIVLAVCDGMGGHDGGEIASMFACEKLTRINRFKISAANVLETLGRIQQEALLTLPTNSGTTVAGLLANEDRIIAFNAGDSRVYRLTNDAITYISHDHSLVQEMIDQSMIEARNSNQHPLRNVIELGIGPAFKNSWSIKKIYIHETRMERPSYYLLCTDGLTDLISDREIHDLLMPDPIENGTRLYNSLRQRKLRDNTSFIIAEIS